MAQAKPAIDTVWGSTGATTDPGTTKMNLGWSAEIPTHDVQNFWQQRADEMLTHINEQGIPVHDVVTDYPVDAWAKGSDGQVYTSLQTPNINQDPTTEAAFWAIAGASTESASRTINIALGSSYAQIQSAFNSVGSYLDSEVVIDIIFADGTYNIGANILVLPSYTGPGIVKISATTTSTISTNIKPVVIEGNGVTWGGFSDAGVTDMVMLAYNSGTIVLTDIKIDLTGASSTVASAALMVVASNVGLVRCTCENTGTANTAYSAAVILTLSSHLNSEALFNVATSHTFTAYGAFVSTGSTAFLPETHGAAEIAYHAQEASTIAYIPGGSFISTTVSTLTTLRGEVFTS
jgi:hypothetical protein